MKNLIFAIGASAIFALATSNVTNAQNVSFKAALKVASDSNLNAVLDKKEEAIKIGSANETAKTAAPAEATISEKAKKNFGKSFAKISNAAWEITDEGFSASFTKEDVRTVVFYDQKGNWNGLMKSYAEDGLPDEIKDAVLQEYYGAKINYVHEILTPSSGGDITYLIQMEDKKHLLEVRYNNGNIDTWKQYNKKQ